MRAPGPGQTLADAGVGDGSAGGATGAAASTPATSTAEAFAATRMSFRMTLESETSTPRSSSSSALALDEPLEWSPIARAEAQDDEHRRSGAHHTSPFAGLFHEDRRVLDVSARDTLGLVARLPHDRLERAAFSAAVVMKPERSECPP